MRLVIMASKGTCLTPWIVIPDASHARKPETAPKRVEVEKSARELATHLKSALDVHVFDRLVLAAPPKFLGILRAVIAHALTQHIEAFVSNDLTHYARRQVKEHLARELSL
jgi:protein required for attachment to host cells